MRLLVLVFPLVAILPRLGAQLIVNGGFESNALAPSENYRYLDNGDSTSITGWTVQNDGDGERPYLMRYGGGGSVEPYPVPSGTFAMDLNIGSGVSTTFAVTAGTTYTVSFLAQSYQADADLRVTLAGEQRLVTVHQNYSAADPYTFELLTTTFTPSVSSSNAVLQFFNPSTGADYKGYYLDDVTVTSAVPEPAMSALLASSLALVLATSLRRRSSQSGLVKSIGG